MKTYLLILLSFILLLTCISPTTAQTLSLGEQLEQKLDGKETFGDIMKEVDDFYNSLDEEAKNSGADDLLKFKHWKRWEWYMSGRLGNNASFVNINEKIYEEINKKEKAGAQKMVIPGNWVNLGPIQSDTIPGFSDSYANGTGRIDRIAFHPSNANIFYVGTPAGGLWKTTDGGVTWTAMSDYIASIGISGIVVSHSNGNTIYILTGTADNNINSFVTQFGYQKASQGVLKSTDGGVTWTTTGTFPLSAGVTKFYGYSITQSPVNQNILLACTTDGIFKTTNGGTSWFRVKNGVHFDLKYKDNGVGDILYTVDEVGMYYSTSYGNSGTWNTSTLNVPTGENKRKSIAVPLGNSSVVYVLTGGATSFGSFSGLYKSTNSGANYTRRSNSPNILGYELDGQDAKDQANYDLCIAVDPSNTNTIITGGVNLWKSTNGGDNLNNLTKWYEKQDGAAGASTPYIHPDHHALEYNPLNNKLYACSDGGIYVSADNGTSWNNISLGIDVSQYYHATQNKAVSYKILGGLQDNGVKYKTKGNSDFHHVHGADGFDVSFSKNDQIIYHTYNHRLKRVDFSDTTSTSINPVLKYFKIVMAHPTSANIVFCGTSSIYRSLNSGSSWSNRGASGSWSMAFAPSNSARMYSAGGSSYQSGGGALYTSTNTGGIWSSISNGSGWPASADWQKITDIAVSQTIEDDVYITFGGFNAGTKVLYSTNGGTSWSNYSYNLPNVPINCIATTAGKVYVGTDIGIYRRTFGSSTWVDISDNLPNTIITEILIDEELGNIKVATFGRGMWQLDYCKDNINLTAKQEGTFFYSCNNLLTATAEVPGNAENDLTLTANGKVELKPGFKALSGSTLKVSTETCDNIAQPFGSEGTDDDNQEK